MVKVTSKYIIFCVVMVFIITLCSSARNTEIEVANGLNFEQEVDITYYSEAKEVPDNLSQEESSYDSALIEALYGYFGEWEIIEDYGYHGIHREMETINFEIGNSIFFQREVLQYNDEIDISYPTISIEITSSATMQQIDGMLYPHQMGFDNQRANYAKIIIYDFKNSSNIVCTFYILNDNEIIIEGDVHRYYKAVRKTD